jgi:hypothetical protein
VRKLFNEFFYIPKHGKIREKVMLTRIAITITIVFMCLAAMSITAYAYFSYNVTSGTSIIKAANFEASVSISITENDSSTTIEVTKHKNASCTANLKAGKVYTITLDESDGSTAKTGFCIVSAIGCPDIYHSQQIGADAAVEGEFTDKITFQLKVTADTTITFVSHWGTSSYYGENNKLYITNDNADSNKVVMVVNGVSETECDAKLNTENTELITDTTTDTEQSSTQATGSTTPSTEITQPTETTSSETTETSESTTEPSSSTTESETQITEPTATETTTTEATTETQSTEENVDTSTTEASKHNEE